MAYRTDLDDRAWHNFEAEQLRKTLYTQERGYAVDTLKNCVRQLRNELKRRQNYIPDDSIAALVVAYVPAQQLLLQLMKEDQKSRR